MKNKDKKRDISILVVDDDELILYSFSQLLRLKGYTAHTAVSGKKALNILSKKKVDIVLTDMKMPEMSGLELLKIVKAKYPDKDVIIITAYGGIDDAVESMKQGASDYILKPFSPDEVLLKIIDIYKKKKGIVEEETKVDQKESFLPKVIAENTTMKQVLEEVEIVAPTDAAVLITGETGVGKDVIASLIHRKSQRKGQPFIRMNCAELNEGIIESELFGHEKGAFTGAISMKKGRLELASKGTLFLDEVGDIPLGIQKKLLRVLEQKEFERVGGTETKYIDVRVIAATNKVISEAVKKKELRKDLLFRLNTVMIHMPPLRERHEDIIPLAEHFLMMFTSGKKRIILSKRVKKMLLSYKWSGNVRELKSTIERAVIFSQDKDIDAERLFRERELFEAVEGTFTLECPSLTLDDVEKSLLLRVLNNANWNIQHSARVLNISRTTLYEKIKRYKLESFKQESFKHLK